jgi:hypothetical protein
MLLTPRWTPLIAHPEQIRLIESPAKVKMVPAGRRCLAEGTMVATPSGPRAIETLVQGDEVIGYNELDCEEITTVEKLWENGIQEVFDIDDCFEGTICKATREHIFLLN